MTKIFKRNVKKDSENTFAKAASNLFNLLLGERFKSYDMNFEVFREDVFNNPTVAGGWDKIKDAYLNIEFKTFKKTYSTVDGQRVMKLVPSDNSYVMNSLEKPSPLLLGSQFFEYMLFYDKFGGMLLTQKIKGPLSSNLNMISPSQVNNIEYYEDRLEIKNITINGSTIEGDTLKEWFIYTPFDPTANIAGMSGGYTNYKALGPIVDLLNFIMKHNTTLAKNSGHKGGMYSMKAQEGQRVSPTVLEELTDKLRTALGSYKKAGKDGVLPPGVEFIETSVNPKDLDWNQGQLLAIKMVASIMGVPLPLMSEDSSTYNNLKTAQTFLYKSTTIPIAKRHAEYLTSIFSDELGENEIIWIDLSSIEELRNDMESLMKTLETNTFLDTNEKRAILAESTGIAAPKRTELGADKIWISSSMMTMEQAAGAVDPEEGAGEE